MNEQSMELQKHAADTWQVIRNRIGLIALSFLLVFSVAAIITYIMPRKYLGKVRMKIERQSNVLPVFNRDMNNEPLVMTENFVKTEFETLTMLETLYPVVDAYNLVQEWKLPGRQEVVNKMRRNLDTQSSIRSDIVDIIYYDENPKRAADIANAIADSYMKKRVELDAQKKGEALKILQKQISEEEQRYDQARLKMQAARTKAGVYGEGLMPNAHQPNMPGYVITNPDETLALGAKQEFQKQEIEVQRLESEINELAKLSEDELVDRMIGLKADSPEITVLMQKQLENSQQLESARKAGLGRNHPTIASLEAALKKGQEQLKQKASDYRNGLATRLAAAQSSRDKLRITNEATKQDILGKQSSFNEFEDSKKQFETIGSALVQLRLRYSEAELSQVQAKAAATIWERAEPQSSPAKPNVPLNLALGGIMGVLFGLGIAFLIEYMDTTVKSIEDIERSLGVPVLAVVPRDVGILHRSSGFNPDAEAYRILRTNIEFNRKNPNANCITVVSGGAGEGKSTTLSNLAFICAQGGYNVLLIDGDLRRPRLHTLFDMSNAVGLTNYLTTNVRLEEVVVQTPVENLFFMPSGILPADSAGILNSQRMTELIEDVKSRFDLVLIDSPPILGVSDASVLANEADMTIIVVQHRKLPRHMLMRVKQAVENVGGNVLGVVLNNVDVRSDANYGYYTSYYTYYSSNGSDTSRKGRKKKRHQERQPVAAAAQVPSAAAASSASRRGGEDIF